MTIEEFQGLSLATLAKLTQKPLSSWSRWTKGRSMSANTLQDCSQRLSMSSDDFLKALNLRKSN